MCQRRIVGSLVGRVENLRTWGADWADYDAPPSIAATIDHARRWIEDFYLGVVARDRLWIDPLITANEEGEVVFEWQHEGRRLSFYVTGTTVTYGMLWDKPPKFQFEDGVIDTVQRAQSLWAWLADQERREEISR